MKIEIALHDALTAPVKRKRNITGKLSLAKLSAQVRRVTARAPEVMVKVSGFGRGGRHVQAHLNYISRHGKLELENERGECLTGKEAVKDLAIGWGEDFGDKPQRKNQRDTLHLVLSMPAGTPPELVRAGSRAFAKATFGSNHEFVMVLHTDTPHPHCHVTVRCEGFDGRRLHYNRTDLQAWREAFAWQMRQFGVDAEATPRVVRGVVKRADKAVLRHIAAGDATHRPRVTRVRAMAAVQAVLVLQGREAPVARPWEARIADNLAKVRAAWSALAEISAQGAHKLTFRGEVLRNERPDYTTRAVPRWGHATRVAGLLKPGVKGAGSRTSAGAVAGLRDLPAVAVVRRRGDAELLLPAHAHVGVVERSPANSAVRWSGTGVGSARGDGEMTTVTPPRVSLAQLVAQFARGLPTGNVAGPVARGRSVDPGMKADRGLER